MKKKCAKELIKHSSNCLLSSSLKMLHISTVHCIQKMKDNKCMHCNHIIHSSISIIIIVMLRPLFENWDASHFRLKESVFAPVVSIVVDFSSICCRRIRSRAERFSSICKQQISKSNSISLLLNNDYMRMYVYVIFFHTRKNFILAGFLAFVVFTLQHLYVSFVVVTSLFCYVKRHTSHSRLHTYICKCVCRCVYAHTIMVHCTDTWLQHNFCTPCNLQCFTEISATVATLSSAKLDAVVCRAMLIINDVGKYPGTVGAVS